MYQYNTYKDSGVEWIGEIPIHWSFVKLKYEYNIQKGKLPNEVFEESSEHLIPYLSMEFLRDKGEPKYVKQTGGVLINEGDLLILWDGSNSGEILKGKRGILSSTTGVLKKTGIQINENYSFYILKCIEPEIRNNTVGMGIPHVDGDFIRSLSLLTPPLHEQEQIVAYLDEKTSQIDRLVQAKERKIALLKEYRSSLISRVVTKGLDPNVKMKDSGVEWLDEIPEHWEVKKLKSCLRLISEKGATNQDDIKISPENVESGTGVCFNLFSEYSGEGLKFQKGDILFNKLRVYLKKIILTEHEGFSMGEMIVLRTFSGINRYYFYSLFHQGYIDFLNQQSNGVKLPRVSPEVILNSGIAYPPLQEQEQIVAYLDEKTQTIDKTIQSEQRKIELLKEFRQSLISSVVTGKIKVTNDEKVY